MIPDNITVVREIDATAITIYPIADTHIGSPQHNTQKWEAFLDRVANEDDSYLILAGDLMDNATRSSVSNPYESTMPPSEQKKVLHDQLWQVKDKILCCCPGNHEVRSAKEVDLEPTYDVFVTLGIQERYRRNMCFMKVTLKYQSFTFCVAHGASKTRTGQFAYALEGIDCLVTGHTHESEISQPSKLVFPRKGNLVRQKDMLKVVVPPWIEYGGYGAAKMYQPKATCKPQAIRLQANGGHIEQKKMSVSSGDLI